MRLLVGCVWTAAGLGSLLTAGDGELIRYLSTVSLTLVAWSTRAPAGGCWLTTEPGRTGGLGGALPVPTGLIGTSTNVGGRVWMPTLANCACAVTMGRPVRSGITKPSGA